MSPSVPVRLTFSSSTYALPYALRTRSALPPATCSSACASTPKAVNISHQKIPALSGEPHFPCRGHPHHIVIPRHTYLLIGEIVVETFAKLIVSNLTYSQISCLHGQGKRIKTCCVRFLKRHPIHPLSCVLVQLERIVAYLLYQERGSTCVVPIVKKISSILEEVSPCHLTTSLIQFVRAIFALS